MDKESSQSTRSLRAELDNLGDIAAYLQPSSHDIPDLAGIEVCGSTIPVGGLIGGDHIIYIDFKKRFDLEARIEAAKRAGKSGVLEELIRNRTRAGVVLADVSGHQITDAVVALMLHQAFLLGVIYELDLSGKITTCLFEKLNTRFYRSSAVNRFITMIYGEIYEEGRFRFITAGHPNPIVFSKLYDQIVLISEDHFERFPPIGTMPSAVDIDRADLLSPLGLKEEYTVNEISLMGSGDLLFLYTDGLAELEVDGKPFVPEVLEKRLRDYSNFSAAQICNRLKGELLSLPRHDDTSFVVIKRS